uniref:Uncharacterized protein n=1 Tax=Zea mays TaxID=4577 RepID=B4FFI6_MAIZE|nr:unknown [Zea mays]
MLWSPQSMVSSLSSNLSTSVMVCHSSVVFTPIPHKRVCYNHVEIVRFYLHPHDIMIRFEVEALP